MEGKASPIDLYLTKLIGKPQPRVCFVGTASGDLPEQIEKFHQAFTLLGCHTSVVAVYRRPGTSGVVPLSEAAVHLLNQDAVFIGGGNTQAAIAAWRSEGLDAALASAYKADVLMAGMSAGAICWFEQGFSDLGWEGTYQSVRGLGLLPGSAAAHCDAGSPQRAQLEQAVARGTIGPGFAIPNGAALLFADEQVSESLVWSGNSSAIRFSSSLGRFTPVEFPFARLSSEA